MLDLQTTFLIFAIILLVITALYTLNFIYNKMNFPGLGWMTLGAINLVMVLVLAFIEGNRGEDVLVVFISAFYISSPLVFYRGIRLFLGEKEYPVWKDALFLGISLSIIMVGMLIDQTNAVRTLFVLIFVIFLHIRLMWILLENVKFKWEDPGTIAAMSYGFLIIMDSFRVFMAIITGKYGTDFVDNQVFIGFTITQATTYLVLAFSILLMVNYRLRLKQEVLTQEKTLLNHELHHRVKNNLNIIQALVLLQEQGAEHPEVKSNLQTAANRIQAIGTLYNSLHKAGRLESLSTDEYIKQIILSLKESLGIQAQGIEISVQVQDFLIDSSQGIPLGLIINEALTNSIKYAFTNQQEKQISLKLELISKYQVELTIKDNGRGFEKNKKEGIESLGMSMMHNLSAQLMGSITIQDLGGIQIVLRFPIVRSLRDPNDQVSQ